MINFPNDESALEKQVMRKILKSHLCVRGFKAHTVQFTRYQKDRETILQNKAKKDKVRFHLSQPISRCPQELSKNLNIPLSEKMITLFNVKWRLNTCSNAICLLCKNKNGTDRFTLSNMCRNYKILGNTSCCTCIYLIRGKVCSGKTLEKEK